jgi:hypothetical protein
MLAVIGLVALGAGIGGGVLWLQRSKSRAAEPAPPAAQLVEPVATSVGATPSEPTAAPPAADPAPPGSGDGTASAAPSAVEPVPSASAPPVETVAPVALPPVPNASFDLEKIPGDRAGLLVRSSAAARVYVHGKDYGETNQYLLTSCGIRFIRIGRGGNDFLEPGRSVVVKCGRVTELMIEPGR